MFIPNRRAESKAESPITSIGAVARQKGFCMSGRKLLYHYYKHGEHDCDNYRRID